MLRTNRWLLVVLFWLSIQGCLPVKPLVAGDALMIKLSSLEQALDKESTTLLSELQEQWQETATCTAQKTGVGLNRRAYFLDACHFDNSAKLTFCGHVPTGADYYFLENALVQVTMSFDTPTTELASCLASESVSKPYRAVDSVGTAKAITATQERLIFAKGEAVAVIIEPAKLSLMKSEVAPDVHFLQAMFAASAK